MTETTARASGSTDATAHPGIVSVQTYSAKTLPGIVGVLLALLGLGLIVGGGVGISAVPGLAALIPVGAILFIGVLPGQYVVQPNQALVLIMF
ncbi:MAG: hypothetical protein J4F44_08320, partial [Acidimicrobiia bacterium]|nr:hypothetical protein [Acidimicrobiia bacterium]